MVHGIIQTIIISAVLKNTEALAGGSVAITISEVVGLSTLAFHRATNIYYGQLTRQKNPNVEAMRETTTFKIVSAYGIVILAGVLVLSIGAHNIIGASTNKNQDVVNYGAPYLNFVLLSWALNPFIYSFNYTLNPSGKAHVAMTTSFIGILCNLLFAFLLVSPDIGELGIIGAPIGEAMSKFIQLSLIFAYIFYQKPLWRPKLKFWQIRKWVWFNSLKTGILIWPAEVLYVIFLLILNTIIYNTMPNEGAAITAAVIPILGSFFGLFHYTLATGIRTVLPRYVSSYMGIDQAEQTKLNAQKVLGVVTGINIVFSLIILSAAWWYPLAYSGALKTDLSKEVAKYMLIGGAFYYFLHNTAKAIMYTVRTGGYQLMWSIIDQFPYFAIYLPLIYVLLYYHVFTVSYMFMIVLITTFLHFILCVVLYYKLDWTTKNLVKPVTLEATAQKKAFTKNIFTSDPGL